MTSSGELERENAIVLSAVQALLGLISPDVIAIAVRVEPDRIELHFWTRRRTSELEEDIEDAIFELDALLAGEDPLIESRVHDGPPDPTKLLSYGRMIYWAKS